jgi:ATP-binding cassette, subfamily B, bacterial IrtA/YbtP
VDVREMSTEDLYRTVGFVFQDVGLLRASVAENLRLAKPSASDTELEEAARAAHIHDRIIGLPRGYDSVPVVGAADGTGGPPDARRGRRG